MVSPEHDKKKWDQMTLLDKARYSAQAVATLRAGGVVGALVSAQTLAQMVQRLRGKRVQFEPADARARDIIENTAAAAATGAGLGALLAITRIVPGPWRWVTLAMAGVGAGAGLIATKYRVRVSQAESDLFHIEILPKKAQGPARDPEDPQS